MGYEGGADPSFLWTGRSDLATLWCTLVHSEVTGTTWRPERPGVYRDDLTLRGPLNYPPKYLIEKSFLMIV